MSSTAPATKLHRRTKVTRSLFDGPKSEGVVTLFLTAEAADPDGPDCFGQVVFACDASKGEAWADVAVATQPASRLFEGERLSAVLLEAFEWAEQEAAR